MKSSKDGYYFRRFIFPNEHQMASVKLTYDNLKLFTYKYSMRLPNLTYTQETFIFKENIYMGTILILLYINNILKNNY